MTTPDYRHQLLIAGAEIRLEAMAGELAAIVSLNDNLKAHANTLLRPILKWDTKGRPSGKKLAADLQAARAARDPAPTTPLLHKGKPVLFVDARGYKHITPRKPMGEAQKARLRKAMLKRWKGAKKAGRSLNDGITHAEAMAALNPNGASA